LKVLLAHNFLEISVRSLYFFEKLPHAELFSKLIYLDLVPREYFSVKD
jgi:hypothetical protein